MFLLLFGVGRLMFSPPDANPLWTWVAILAGLALVPLWLRYLLQEDLEVDRSLQAEDTQVTERALLAEPNGLAVALRQLAQHMKIVYGMEIEVEAAGVQRLEEEGRRIVLFQLVQDLLLFMVQRDRTARARVVLSQPNGCQQVLLESVRAPVNLRTPPEWGYKVLDHIEERLYQVEGRLRVEPDASRASRITMTVPTEGTAEAWREAAE